jgi:MFS family permease
MALFVTESAGYWALLRDNPHYRRLWLGLAASMIGDWFRTMALYHLVLQLTGASGLALGGVVIAQTASLFVLSPVAGVAADRFSRKWIMVGTDLVRAVLALGFLLITSAERLWLAYVLTAVLTAVSAFFHPAYAATIPNITTRRELVAANALGSASWAAMLAIGTALGGVVTAWLGTSEAFLLDAASYVVSAGCILRVAIPSAADSPDAGRTGWQAFRRGLRYMAARPYVLRLLSVKACSVGLTGGMMILIALFAENIFEVGAIGMGTLFMARGLGALLGPLLARRLVGEEPQTMVGTIGGAFVLAGGFYVLFGATPTLGWAALALFMATMASNVLWVFSSTLLQISVPDAYRGRVFAADFMLFTVIMTVAILATAWGLDHTALTPRTLAVISGSLLVLSGAFWIARPQQHVPE